MSKSLLIKRKFGHSFWDGGSMTYKETLFLPCFGKYINHRRYHSRNTNSIDNSFSYNYCEYYFIQAFVDFLKNQKMRSGDWICCSCQHHNFKRRDVCQLCRCPKFASSAEMASSALSRTEVLPGDWYCCTMNCGAHNYASRTICYSCGAIKDESCGGSCLPGWKEGDWICSRPGCAEHNYASRTECYKCKTRKGSTTDLGTH